MHRTFILQWHMVFSVSSRGRLFGRASVQPWSC